MRTPSNVYILENEEQCCMSQTNESLLWHRRMDHLKFYNLVNVSKNGVVRNFPKFIKPPNHVCRHCLHGKQTRTSFKVKDYTTSHPLEIFHTDIYGPTMNKSFQGEHYFMLLIQGLLGWHFLKKNHKSL